MPQTEWGEDPKRDRPYVVMAIFPGHQSKPMGRYVSRTEAEAALRFLQRRVPAGRFYVIHESERQDW